MQEGSRQLGAFWLPESPDHKVLGEFELVDNSVGILTLYDAIDSKSSIGDYFNNAPHIIQHPLIVGKLKNGDCLALLQSKFKSIKSKDLEEYIYSIDTTIYTNNVIIENIGQLKFRNISFSFNNLSYYLGSCFIEAGLARDNNKFTINCERETESFSITKPMPCTCTFDYAYDYSMSFGSPVVEIAPYTFIELDFPMEQAPIDIIPITYAYFGQLFSIILGTHLFPINMKLKSELSNEPFKVFFRHYKENKEILFNKRNSIKRLIPNLHDYIRNFIDFYGSYSLVVLNYTSSLRNEATLEFKFLSAAYSIETFSRYVCKEHYYLDNDIFESEYKKPLNQYIDNIFSNNKHENYIKRLRTSIEYTNERSFRNIVKQLSKDNDDILKHIFGKSFKYPVELIVDSRNWYTHYSEKLEENAAKGMDLYPLFLYLRILFDVLLFKRIEMTDEHIIQTIETTYLSLL